jgi:RNA methyltransferase, TrmH family
MESIASSQNALVKLARKLSRSGHERRLAAKTLLDGVHLIEAYAGRFGLDGVRLLVAESTVETAEFQSLLAQGHPDRCAMLPDVLFRTISPVETPTGVAAIVDIPKLDTSPADGESWLLLDGIQDPGNLGSILRTAAATGIARAFLSKTCTDVWSPKCLRGGMGAQFVLPCRHQDLASVIAAFPGRSVATAPRQGIPLAEADLRRPTALLFGAEGSGLGPELLTGADCIVHIPLAAEMESLNVAAAVAMCCYERLRQSRFGET